MNDTEAAMIGLDMGGGEWRAAWVGDSGIQVLSHRFASRRWAPFIEKRLLPAEDGYGETQILIQSYKRLIGQPTRRSLIGESSIRKWLSRRLAALHDDVAAEIGASRLGLVAPLPSCFRDRERREVIEAAQEAGFLRVDVPDESALVVNDFLAADHDGAPLMYFHLGATTLSFDLFTGADARGGIQSEAYEGASHVGGDDMDLHLMHLILANITERLGVQSIWDLRRYADERLRGECEAMKIAIATGRTDMARMSVERFRVRQAALPLGFELMVNVPIFNDTIAPVVEGIGESAERFFSRVRAKKYSAESVKRVIVGGAAALGMPAILDDILGRAGVRAETLALPANAYLDAAARHAKSVEPAFIGMLREKDPADLPQRVVEPFDPDSEGGGSAEEAARQAIADLAQTTEAALPETAGVATRPIRRAEPEEEPRTPTEETEPQPAASSSKWVRKYGEWIAEAERLQKQDPPAAVAALATPAAHLLDLAQRIGARAPECGAQILPLAMLGYAFEVFLGASFGMRIMDGLDPADAVAAAIEDPILGAVLAAGRALSACGDGEAADEALKLAASRVEKSRKSAARAKDPAWTERAGELAGLLLKTQAAIEFSEAERLFRGFERHCELSRQVPAQDRRRECEIAAGELRRAVELMDRIAHRFRQAGRDFAGCDYDISARKWQEALRACDAERRPAPGR